MSLSVRRLAQTVLLALTPLAVPAARAAHAPPDVAVFVAQLDLQAGQFSEARNITPGKGSNLQPAYGIEMDQASRWLCSWDGKPVAPVMATKRMGHHAWEGPKLLAAIPTDGVPGRKAHRAVLIARTTGQQTLLTDKPGRALADLPELGRTMRNIATSADGKRLAFAVTLTPTAAR